MLPTIKFYNHEATRSLSISTPPWTRYACPLQVYLPPSFNLLVYIVTPEWWEALWELMAVLPKNSTQWSRPVLEPRTLELVYKATKPPLGYRFWRQVWKRICRGICMLQMFLGSVLHTLTTFFREYLSSPLSPSPLRAQVWKWQHCSGNISVNMIMLTLNQDYFVCHVQVFLMSELQKRKTSLWMNFTAVWKQSLWEHQKITKKNSWLHSLS